MMLVPMERPNTLLVTPNFVQKMFVDNPLSGVGNEKCDGNSNHSVFLYLFVVALSLYVNIMTY